MNHLCPKCGAKSVKCGFSRHRKPRRECTVCKCRFTPNPAPAEPRDWGEAFAMKKAGYSQKEIADHYGVSQPRISEILNKPQE